MAQFKPKLFSPRFDPQRLLFNNMPNCNSSPNRPQSSNLKLDSLNLNKSGWQLLEPNQLSNWLLWLEVNR